MKSPFIPSLADGARCCATLLTSSYQWNKYSHLLPFEPFACNVSDKSKYLAPSITRDSVSQPGVTTSIDRQPPGSSRDCGTRFQLTTGTRRTCHLIVWKCKNRRGCSGDPVRFFISCLLLRSLHAGLPPPSFFSPTIAISHLSQAFASATNFSHHHILQPQPSRITSITVPTGHSFFLHIPHAFYSLSNTTHFAAPPHPEPSPGRNHCSHKQTLPLSAHQSHLLSSQTPLAAPRCKLDWVAVILTEPILLDKHTPPSLSWNITTLKRSQALLTLHLTAASTQQPRKWQQQHQSWILRLHHHSHI